MKLNIVPARSGAIWVRQGVRTFFRQPLALAGLFFMFMALLSLLALVPIVGGIAALAAVPAATLGLMAAAREAEAGRFPMPGALFVAFRQGRAATQAMLKLGAFYALAVIAVMAVTALIDQGQFAQLYIQGGGITPQMIIEPKFHLALWVSTILYLPISLAFWHAPALVHWHHVPPLKSLFFSLVAVLKNARAFLLYGLLWLILSMAAGLMLLLLTMMVSSEAGAVLAGIMLLPLSMLIASIFFTSLWFTFRDSFSSDDEPLQVAP